MRIAPRDEARALTLQRYAGVKKQPRNLLPLMQHTMPIPCGLHRHFLCNRGDFRRTVMTHQAHQLLFRIRLAEVVVNAQFQGVLVVFLGNP